MKLAILTDIHGNAPALRAVLSDIDRRGGTDRICCLGDMIGIGPDSDEVLEAIMNRGDASAISGNHEEAVLHLLDGQGALPGHEAVAEHHAWIGSRLTPRSVEFIRSLPQTLEIEAEGLRLLMTHYHRSGGELDPIDEAPSGTKLDRTYANSPYDLVCFGHHHPIHHFQTERRTYVNPGALGCGDRAAARYAIAELQNGTIRVHLLGVAYDNRDFLESFERLQVPDRDFILRVFHGNQLNT
ncbi:metallophosphoesterase family protein [Saccharibacillus alkalitolerans]|uniref:Metallophosphoesterase family protein n=1 Tax=Saccharibacillus alkalitolerans TaxID=2705290 RepID=A0ABX0FCC2_9BACL|nr:metallophosphoesterase family protein [Saccharibacillus alkalitolerans]NGZ76931.1 metallophosphoesterase family protein [Saccharibacillus alkalitolerans]